MVTYCRVNTYSLTTSRCRVDSTFLNVEGGGQPSTQLGFGLCACYNGAGLAAGCESACPAGHKCHSASGNNQVQSNPVQGLMTLFVMAIEP